jgi:hypothetical protein
VSKLGGVIAFSAEAGIWIAGAALIASAAGMHWSVDLPAVDLTTLTGSSPSAAAPGSQLASASASAAVNSPKPVASPTISPIVGRYLAVVAKPDFQFKGEYTSSTTFTLSGTAFDDSQTGTMSYKAGDTTDSRTETINGAVSTYDYVFLGSTQYESRDGAAWTKSARPASDVASTKLLFTPALTFVDKGVETKNGTSLHRLEIADQDAFSAAMLKTSDGASAAQLKYTVWVADDGTPADFKLEGWMQTPVSGVSTKVTTVEEFSVTATSGVTITAPI